MMKEDDDDDVDDADVGGGDGGDIAVITSAVREGPLTWVNQIFTAQYTHSNGGSPDLLNGVKIGQPKSLPGKTG